MKENEINFFPNVNPVFFVHFKLVNYTLIKPLIDLGKAKIKYLHTKKIPRPNDFIGKLCLRRLRKKS